MDELIVFLRARLDEDERIAREADAISRDAMLDLYEDLIKSRPLDDQRRAYGVHISTFTSGRMLWDIAAKQQIVDACVTAHAKVERLVGEHETTEAGRAWRAGALLEVLRILALPYASHHEYRQEWRQ